MKKWFVLGLVLLFSQLFSYPIHAQTNAELFHTRLHTTVTANEGSSSLIQHNFTITNKTPTTYLSQYGLKISSSELKNISVMSNGQRLAPETVVLPPNQQSGPGQTSIGITFPEKIVGEGKKREFTISYTHPDAAVISGSVLEITLPAQANATDYQEYPVTLITPLRFGTPVRTTPNVFTHKTEGGQIMTNFDNGANGIFALYGKTQLFNLHLSYYLENDTDKLGIAQIALPPDTAYQQLHYEQLDPKPESLERDKDGNWIATYKLAASSNIRVGLQAVAKISLDPNQLIPTELPTGELTKSAEFWPVNDERVEEELEKIKREGGDFHDSFYTAYKINKHVVATLSYGTQRALNSPERQGALLALDQPTQAVCQEYTDLFITLARNAKIPSRRLTGFAHTQNSELRPLSLVEDVLHAWPEYYNVATKQWTPIDPTWEDTTGGVDYFNQRDLNHIVFAINGHDSVTPYPVGSYRENESDKTVDVTFGSIFPEKQFDSEYALIPKKVLGFAVPGWYQLQITNTTGRAWYNLPIKIEATESSLNITRQQGTIQALLPFQTITIPFFAQSNMNLLPTSDTITLAINNDSQTFEIISGPAISHYLQEPGILLAVAVGCVVIALGTGSLLVLRRRRQRPLRR